MSLLTAAQSISVVVPVHNESEHVRGQFLRFWSDLGDDRRAVREIVLVENGSTDRTWEACRNLAAEHQGLFRLERIPEASYGRAVKLGIEVAVGEVVCVLECDFLDVAFLRRASALIVSGDVDLVVGSKRAEGAEDRRPALRRLLTAAFNRGLKALFGFPGTDTHGLKAFRGETAKRLLLLSRTGGEAFQTELVLLAHRLGFRVREVPVDVREKRPLRISIIRRVPAVWRALLELRASLRRFPPEKTPGQGGPAVLGRLFSERWIVGVLLILTLLFQLATMTRSPLFYHIAAAPFFLLAIQCLGGLVRLVARRKILAVVLLFIVALRIPFYLAPRGLITNSDNATEYLQCQDMKSSGIAPLFLLDAIRHGGTFRYMCVSFLWGVAGNRPILYTIVQLAFFLALLYLFFRLVEPLVEKPVLLFLAFFHFAFIEVAFDYSLSLRGGPYLEMLVFLLLGMNLFDLGKARPLRTLAAFYFLGFAAYLHPLALLFVLSFLAVVILRSASAGRLWRSLAWSACGFLAGIGHWVWSLRVIAGPGAAPDSWSKVSLGGPGILSRGHLEYVGQSVGRIFSNLFRHDFAFGRQFSPEGPGLKALSIINAAVILFSTAVFLGGLALAAGRVLRRARKKEPFEPGDWWAVFLIILGAGFLAKTTLLSMPLLEPRHNFELLFLVMLSYPLVLSAAWRSASGRLRGLCAAVLAAFFAAAVLPHGLYYLANARLKNRDYGRLVALLREQRVKHLTTGFEWAYTIYFLSGRTVQVSDSLGPDTFSMFYLPMVLEVNGLPRREKAFLFFSDDAKISEDHRVFARERRNMLIRNLKEAGVPFKEFRLESCLLVVPKSRDAVRP